MKRLKIKPNPVDNYHWKYKEDIQKIQESFNLQGFQISESDAIIAWERYSDMYAAGWLILPENWNEIYFILRDYFEEEE